MALMPPVSAINGTIGPRFSASVRLIAQATAVDPVKATPATCACAVSRAPDLPRAEHQVQRACGHTRLVQQPHRLVGNQRRLLGGFGDHRIARGECRTTWPRKIASGKFHGEMHTNTPRPRRRSRLSSPVGPGRVSGVPNKARA